MATRAEESADADDDDDDDDRGSWRSSSASKLAAEARAHDETSALLPINIPNLSRFTP